MIVRSVNDDAVLSPTTYVKITLRQLWENLPQVLMADLLFVLCAAPALVLALLSLVTPALLAAVLTAAPAWTAMLALLAAATAPRSRDIGRAFFRAYRTAWRASVQMGTWIVVPALIAYGAWLQILLDGTALVLWGLFFLGLLGLMFVAALYLYAYPLVVLHEQPARVAARNAFVLAGRYPLNTVGILALIALGIALSVTVSWGLLVLWPAVWGLFVLNNCRLALRMEHERENHTALT